MKSKNIKALYVSFDVEFVNENLECAKQSISKSVNVLFFGPGYVSNTILHDGVGKFLENNGPFDFIICDEFTIQNFDVDPGQPKPSFTNYACKFDRNILQMGKEYFDFFKSYKGKRIIFLTQSDFYNFTRKKMDAVEKVADYFVCWGKELCTRKESFDVRKLSSTGLNHTIYEKWNTHFEDFLCRRSDNVISFPHLVSSQDIYSATLLERPRDWSCVGADYDTRVAARKILDGADISRAGKQLPRIFSVAKKIGVNLFAHHTTVSMVRWIFRQALRRSKYSFTCGSLLQWPIRKFFEIPINGAVLVCEPPKGFQELGFISGKNAMVTEAKDLLDLHEWLEQDPERAQSIADAGRRLVLEKHSVEARVAQIGFALNTILDDRFHRSRWKDGEFQLLENPTP